MLDETLLLEFRERGEWFFEGLVFRSIRDGAGLAMPPFKTEVVAQDDLWHLVNFVRSLWPK